MVSCPCVFAVVSPLPEISTCISPPSAFNQILHITFILLRGHSGREPSLTHGPAQCPSPSPPALCSTHRHSLSRSEPGSKSLASLSAFQGIACSLKEGVPSLGSSSLRVSHGCRRVGGICSRFPERDFVEGTEQAVLGNTFCTSIGHPK